LMKEGHLDWGVERISALLLRGPALPASPQAVARAPHEAGYETHEAARRESNETARPWGVNARPPKSPGGGRPPVGAEGRAAFAGTVWRLGREARYGQGLPRGRALGTGRPGGGEPCGLAGRAGGARPAPAHVAGRTRVGLKRGPGKGVPAADLPRH